MPMPQLPQVPSGARAKALMSSQWVRLWLDGVGLPTQFGRSFPRVACNEDPRVAVVEMLVIRGAVANSGRRVCSGAQVLGSPTPGRGWFPSTGVTRYLALCPTYPTLTEVEAVSRNSVKTFHCCVNCGLRFGSKARTWPEGLSRGTRPAKPLARLPGPVEAS